MAVQPKMVRVIPERPEYWDEREEYLFKVDYLGEMPLGLEWVAAVEAGGEKYQACIPYYLVVDPGEKVIASECIGTVGGKLLMVFAPSSFGTDTWRISREAAEAIRVYGYEDGPVGR